MKGLFRLAFPLVLFSIVLSLWAVGLPKLQTAYASPYINIDVETAYNMITNGSFPELVILDVRNQSEYDSGHIYDAVWIPQWQLETRIDELANHKDHEIIVYCRSGGRSTTASTILDFQGFTKVYNMQGGILAWESADYPVWIATVHNVNTTFNYDTIQAAIDVPQTLAGHTIFVDEGTYYEHVALNKSLSLIGENRSTTIIDGNNSGTVVEITASNVKITGFTVQNGYRDNPYYGVYVGELATGTNISYNIITNNGGGVHLMSSSNIVFENSITYNLRGVVFGYSSSNNTISGNNIKTNDLGVWVNGSSNNTLYKNQIIDNNNDGIQITSSSDNTFFGNEIKANDYSGIRLDSSYNNTFYHNNFDNTQQVHINFSLANFWDDGFEGNYWSDYDGVDTDRDGIGENWLEIDENNTDRYPLMGVFSGFDTSMGHIYTICNSTISNFQCHFDSENQTNVIKFNVDGTEGLGFCRICIPHIVLNETYIILVDGDEPDYVNYAFYDNGTHRWIYFTYLHSIHEVIIIPEFSSVVILPLFLIATLLAVIVLQKKTFLKLLKTTQTN